MSRKKLLIFFILRHILECHGSFRPPRGPGLFSSSGKEEVTLPAVGSIQVHVYTSRAQIPVPGAAVAILDQSGNLIAARITDESGRIKPVEIEVPDVAESLDPNFVGQPFATVTIKVLHPSFEQIEVENAQVFAGVTTIQQLELVPLAAYPESYDRVEYFEVPPQNL